MANHKKIKFYKIDYKSEIIISIHIIKTP